MPNSTFESHDKLSLHEFGEKLFRFIQTENIFVDGSFVISLEGTFGTGKTTFVRMWHNWILELGLREDVPIVVSLNAWESDIGEDPVLAIVSDLTDAIEKFLPKQHTGTIKKIKSTAGKVGKIALSLASDYVSHSVGVDPLKAMESTSKEKSFDKIGLNAFESFEFRKKSFSKLRLLIREVVGDKNLRFLLIVDELDRCRPTYAIQYLEALKHLFDERGLAVLLAVDPMQLSSTAKAAFGNDLNFSEYYRKFAHRRVDLPALNEPAARSFSKALISRFFESEELIKISRFSIAKTGSNLAEDFATCMLAFDLTPRQMEEVCRMMAHSLVTSNSNNSMNSTWVTCLIFMACLRMKIPKTYHKIGKGTCSPDEFKNDLESVQFFVDGAINHEWKFIIAAAFSDPSHPVGRVASAFHQSGFEYDTVVASLQNYKRLLGVTRQSVLRTIYITFEKVDRFVKD